MQPLWAHLRAYTSKACNPSSRISAASVPVSLMSRPTLLDNETGPPVISKVSTVILDCDGVLWQGTDVVPNAIETLQYMRNQGKRLLFVTNNSSKSRAQYTSKFASMGIPVQAHEIVASSYAAAAYLSSIGFSRTLLPGKRGLVFGSQGMVDELGLAGIPAINGEELQLPVLPDPDSMKKVQLDPSIGAVVLGWDPTFSYSKLQYASMCLREMPGCLLVATNLDHADNIGGGRVMVGTGSLVAAVEVGSGRQAVNVGKGGHWLFPYLLEKYHLSPVEACIIGDRLDTDIAMGKEGDLVTILPLTGMTSIKEAMGAESHLAPQYIVPSVAALAGLQQ